MNGSQQKWDDLGDSLLHRLRLLIDQAIDGAVLLERAACADIAERIRAREIEANDGAPPFYDLIAEEIRDRIRMRPATTDANWRDALPESTNRKRKT